MSIGRQRLLFGILLAAGTILVAIAAKYIPCTAWINEVRTKLGTFESFDEGVRSSVRKLAAEIRRCPGAEVYRVIWESPGPEGYVSVLEQAVLYDRAHKRLGWEHDIGSGIAGKAYIVDDEDIHKVAERDGSLADFAEYDQTPRSGN